MKKRALLHHSCPVSIVGFGTDAKTSEDYWIIQNSWGKYWGDIGFAHIAVRKNMMGIKDHIAWVTPGMFTTKNVTFSKDRRICGGRCKTMTFPAP